MKKQRCRLLKNVTSCLLTLVICVQVLFTPACASAPDRSKYPITVYAADDSTPPDTGLPDQPSVVDDALEIYQDAATRVMGEFAVHLFEGIVEAITDVITPF